MIIERSFDWLAQIQLQRINLSSKFIYHHPRPTVQNTHNLKISGSLKYQCINYNYIVTYFMSENYISETLAIFVSIRESVGRQRYYII